MPMLLLLRLEGPLQSWGERSRWDYRDSAPMPTKSGIIGMLGCAFGYARQDPNLVGLDSSLQMGVRSDRPGSIMRDYQTVSGLIQTADGKYRGKKGEITTLVSSREYLQDASFLVVLAGDEGLLVDCQRALSSPVWPYYLGRKSCVPTKPVLESIPGESSLGLTRKYDSVEDVLMKHPVCKGTDEVILAEIENHQGPSVRRDRVLGTPSRTYGLRRVKVMPIKPPEEA